MALADRSTYFDVGDGSILGCFEEQETGNFFEFSENPEVLIAPPAHGGRGVVFPHLVWVGGVVGSRTRYARVLKTAVHIITDETEFGWVVEKWYIKNRRLYQAR